MNIGLFNRTMSEEDVSRAALLEEKLRAAGAVLFHCGRDFTSWDDFPDEIELLLSLGGDGTFLRALTLVRGRDVAVAGINFGHLGFLTTAQMGVGDSWIEDLASGNFETQRRDLIKCACRGHLMPDDFYPYAANEISLQRQGAGMLSIDLTVDGRPLPTYWADGLVISTPTGSTAYSLSIGGPIVMPESKVLVITPIAPHNLNVRPLVVPLDCTIGMCFTSRDGEALLMCDNRSVSIPCGTEIAVGKGDYGFRYVSLHGSNFINALRTKLLWGQDKRNFF